MEVKYYLVEEKELIELIADSISFCALQDAGVDNWEWYGEAFKDILQEDQSIYDLAKDLLNDYEEYKW